MLGSANVPRPRLIGWVRLKPGSPLGPRRNTKNAWSHRKAWRGCGCLVLHVHLLALPHSAIFYDVAFSVSGAEWRSSIAKVT